MANELAVSPKGTLVKEIGAKLEAMLIEQAGAFPKDFNQTRFLQNCLAVLIETKDIERCTPISVVRTMIKGAYLGLDFFRKECYAIPYGDVCTFMPDYKGNIKLAKRYGKGVKDIYAKVVKEGDVFNIGIGDGLQTVDFTPEPFNDKPIKGVFAVVVFVDGTIKYETMSVKEVDDVRNKYSKVADGPSWKKSWPEMAKKTVLQRLCKMIDLDFENIEQEKAYRDAQEGDLKKEAHKEEKEVVKDPFKAPEPAQAFTEAVITQPEDPDAELKSALRKKFPGEEDWKIEARIKESRGEA
jgi:recombination protein RecT